MPPLLKRLSLLKGRDPASAGAILAAAIPHAEPEEREVIARAALETGHPAAIAAVLRSLHRLPPEVMEILDTIPGPFETAVRAALARSDRQTAENVIAVIARRGEASLACHLLDLLGQRGEEWEDVPERAARALLEVTVAVVGAEGRRIAEPAAMEKIDEALAAAGRDFRRHREDAILLAVAITAPRPGPSVTRLLDEEDHPLPLALRGVAERIGEPLVRGNLIRWLGFEPLAGSVARWLHRLDGPEAWGDALHTGHLLLAPRRRRRLRQVDRPLQCLPALTAGVALPSRSQAWVAALVGGLGLSTRARHQRLADMIAMPWPIARLRSLLILLGQQSGRAMEAIKPFCLDRDHAVARAAAQPFLADRAPADPALLVKLERSEHASVSRRAMAKLARSSVAGFFQRWHRMSGDEQRAAALCLLARSRGRFVAGLRAVLREGDVDDQLEAVLLARRLRLVNDLEEELVALAVASSGRLASAAVAALPAERSPRCREALLAGLGHENARVRANAIEGLARTAGMEVIDSIRPLTGSAENRPRANAVRAVLRADRQHGLGDLRRMLADPRPLHRVSAIWVARSAGVIEAAGDLHRLAREDRLPEIRTRARAALRLLGRHRRLAQVEEAAR